MADNILGNAGGHVNFFYPFQDVNVADLPITSTNTAIIRTEENGNYISNDPSKLINRFSVLRSTKMYTITAFQNYDLTAYGTTVPLQGGGGSAPGTVIVTEPDFGTNQIGTEG